MKALKFFKVVVPFIVLLLTSNFISIPISAPGDEAYLAFAEVMPEPIGGIEGIYKKIEYPNVAKMAGIEGKVYVLVFINESGSVDDAKVIKGIGGGCDEAVMKAVKDSKFKPASNGGTPTKVKLSLSFTFKLK